MSWDKPRPGQRLDDLPEHGQVVLCHPLDEHQAMAYATERGLPYLARKTTPRGQLFVMDLDALLDA